MFASQNFSPRLTNHIVNVANKKGVDPVLVYAVIHQESVFRLDAQSNAGAKGLMQVMPVHYTPCGVSNPFDAYQNTVCGIGILASCLKKYKGNVSLALAEYNAGSGTMEKYRKKLGYYNVPNIGETENYVASITSHYQKLKGA